LCWGIFQVVSDYSEDAGNLSAHEDKNLIAASKCLNIIYYASILGGKVDKEVEKAPGSIVTNMLQQKLKQEDQELSMLVDGSGKYCSLLILLEREALIQFVFNRNRRIGKLAKFSP